MKITKIELSKDKNQNDMKVVEVDGKKVYINSKYNSEVYAVIAEGMDCEIEMDGKFWKIKPESVGVEIKPVTYVKKGNSEAIAKAQEVKATNISQAQERNEVMWAKYGACLLVANHPAYRELVGSNDVESAVLKLANIIKNDNLAPF